MLSYLSTCLLRIGILPSLLLPRLRWHRRTRLCLDCTVRITTFSLVNLALAFNCTFGHLFVEHGSLFFPFRSTYRRNSVRLSPEHQPKHRGPHTHDDDQGADDIHSGRDTFSSLLAEVTKNKTKFNWRLRKVFIVKIWYAYAIFASEQV